MKDAYLGLVDVSDKKVRDSIFGYVVYKDGSYFRSRTREYVKWEPCPNKARLYEVYYNAKQVALIYDAEVIALRSYLVVNDLSK